MIFVYIVKCNNEVYYTGITSNPRRRIAEHNSGIKTSLQRIRRPVKLVYLEGFLSRIEAAKKEKEIKGWCRKKKENLINKSALKRKIK